MDIDDWVIEGSYPKQDSKFEIAEGPQAYPKAIS
jgi:hypothetical protein